MTIPQFLLAFTVSTLIGALFHLWRGGGAGRLFFYLCLSWIGFASGQLIAEKLEWRFDLLGSIHIFASVSGSIVLLWVGYWLSLVKKEAD